MPALYFIGMCLGIGLLMITLSKKLLKKIIGGVLILIFVIMIFPSFPHIFRNTYIIRVTSLPTPPHITKIDKNNKPIPNGGSNYRVLGINHDTGKGIAFKNFDSWLELKKNSANLQAIFEIGKDYEVLVYGFRIPWFSVYQNIIKVEALKGY